MSKVENVHVGASVVPTDTCLLVVLKLNMKFILLSNPYSMVESACLCSKPFRMTACKTWPLFTMKTREKGQIVIITPVQQLLRQCHEEKKIPGFLAKYSVKFS